MTYRGDIRLGDTIDVFFTTRRFSTGAPFTLATSAGSPTGPTIVAFVGSGAVPISAGITLTVDVGSITGLNRVSVVASSGNGFATATNVGLVISNGTVDSVSVIGEVVAGFSIENRSALMPTTAARTLDVTATGEAGVDWANVGAPTTTVGLTNTTISTSQVVASVTGAVGSVTGSVGSVTGSVGSVTGSVGSVTGAVGSVTGNVGGNVTGSVGSIASGGITSASFAADSITASAIATDAIGSAELAASAVTEIQSGLATSASIATLQTDTDDIQTRLPAALVGGRMDSSVGAMAAGVVTAAAIATDAIDADALAADAVTEIQSGLATQTTVLAIKAVTDKYDTLLQAGSPQAWTYTADALHLAPTGGAGSAPTASDVALAVWGSTLESPYTAEDLLRIIAAVSAGKTSVTVGSPTTNADVIFRDVTDASNIVTAEMLESQRVNVVLAP